MKKNGQLTIDINDWIEEIKRKELIVTTRDEMLQVGIEHGPQIAAIAAIVSRHLGLAPEEILRPNKTLVQKGAEIAIYQQIRWMRVQLEIADGREVSVPMYNKPPASREEYDDDDGFEMASEAEAVVEDVDRSYAEAGSDRYFDNAVSYLLRIVPGHIRNRLAEIAVSKGIDEAKKYANEIHDKVDRIVEDLERAPIMG